MAMTQIMNAGKHPGAFEIFFAETANWNIWIGTPSTTTSSATLNTTSIIQ